MTEKHVLRILGREGDVAVAWDPAVKTDVDTAKEKFDELKAKGYLTFAIDAPGKTPEQVRTFDPKAFEIVAVPQFQGG
jgi:hypothetical protein